MKLKKISLLFSAFFVFFLHSCEKEIVFKGDKTKPFLVLNSLINADSIINVHLSKSRFFLDADRTASNINNAAVTLWVNDQPKGAMQFTEAGKYHSDYRPKAGDRIKITASESTLGTVSTTATLPYAPQVLKIDTTYTKKIEGSFTEYNLNIHITFKDNSDTEDYYLVFVKQKDYYGNTDYHVRFVGDDVVFKNEKSGGFMEEDDSFGTGKFNIFSDALINGKEYTLKTKIISSNSDFGLYAADYFICFQKISKDWYLYLRSISLVNQDEMPFYEPVQVHSNVQGGIGILGTANTTVRVIKGK